MRGILKDAYKGREATYRGKQYRLGAQWLVVTRSDNPLLSDGGEEEESHEDAKALRGHEEGLLMGGIVDC